jgi:hypothetical protein
MSWVSSCLFSGKCHELAAVAPIGTATIAFGAAVIAAFAIRAQRDIARRRAAIDFFLKTETDEKLIKMYNTFCDLNTLHKAVTSQAAYDNFKNKKTEFEETRAFLNILELIAVGVNQKAFSDRVSYDYWGDVLMDGWED